MAHELHVPQHTKSYLAASAILPRQAVKKAGTSVLFVLPAGTCADRPFGLIGPATVGASGLNDGEQVAVYHDQNIVKAIAGASFGVGQEMMVGSTNGILMPALAASLFAASGHWTVGTSETPAAAANEVFSLYVQPRKA